MSILQANEITIRIIDKTIIHGLSLSVPEGKVTSIIGPNGCGKSTTLKALARIWPCYKGNVTFNGEDIKKFSHREFAQKLAILTQAPQSPADLTVKDLAEMGRFPHRNWFGRTCRVGVRANEYAGDAASSAKHTFWRGKTKGMDCDGFGAASASAFT